MRQQIDFMHERDTQAELRIAPIDSNLAALSHSINRLLKKYRTTGREIETNDALLRETITSLSHDLRTPLATANGYIQLLLEEQLSARQREYAEISGERIAAVKNLLNQLFEFARIEANELTLHKEQVNVNNVLRDALASYYSDFENRHCTPQIDIADQASMIWGDKDALARIFSNVIYNALIHGDGNYMISCINTEQQCCVTVSNRSSTIDAADIPRLFDRFYTTDRSRTKKTTGLGLAIVKKLVESMEGTISAHLKEQQFEIHICFPLLHK
ncbi:sensor histidine kinase KdpD [Paenibacillus sp. NEAU-GSW1]|uniref:sensor histidine kinase n=1 Tax=Paenibacillus sp. NEAU-GSW1 TaxID=2682486 RepID=UPI001C12B186|nr:HAMP domain-containing sensor histidine kinase [Paenibacillus sp. NEAU-GSW1]